MLIMKDNKIGPARVKVSSSRSYTLKEIEALAREWANELQVDTVDQLIVSSLLLWLAKREREGL